MIMTGVKPATEGTMRAIVIAAAFFLAALADFPAQAAGYYVYCANSKIEVDSRDPAQMKTARGSGVCQMGSFGFRMDAESFAKKNFGGVGGKCACR
jgi:hypothetical protein